MSKYPILVDRWSELHPADVCVCEKCHKTFKWDPSEGDPYDLCATHGNASAGECGGNLVMKYTEAERCKGCRKLGFFEDVLNGCCSRVCMLQAEYAESLRQSA